MKGLFDFEKQPLKIRKHIRLIELFAGIGAQASAFERLGADFEHYRICEFDKYAVKSYNAIHGTNFQVSDITKISAIDLGINADDVGNCYIMTYSFPCTDLSLAGKQLGMSRDSGTRSGLLWEVERLLKELAGDKRFRLPDVLVMENVPQVHSDKNIEDWKSWIFFLDSLGYTTEWEDMNAKDYGIAQNRLRTIAVSWLGDYRFDFPAPIKLVKNIADYLEPDVDERYYLSKERTDHFIKDLEVRGELPIIQG